MLLKCCDFMVKVLLAIVLDIYIFLGIVIIHEEYFSYNAQIQHAREIYEKIVSKTGLSNEMVPLVVEESDVFNAYASNAKVVITSYDVVNLTDDELALMVGHEVAHITLGHVQPGEPNKTDQQIERQEAMADKLGGMYMLQAGYDICKGRNLWKKLEKNGVGDYLQTNHPPYSYRYAQHSFTCD